MKKTKKALCAVMAALTLFTGTTFAPEISSHIMTEPVSVIQSVDANAASVTRGRFNGSNWTGYTTVYSSNTRKTKSIKICTFDVVGCKSWGTIDYEVYSGNKRIASNYNGKGTDAYISLPKGYSSYKIRIRPHNYGSGIIAKGRNFTNTGKCVMWSIDH